MPKPQKSPAREQAKRHAQAALHPVLPTVASTNKAEGETPSQEFVRMCLLLVLGVLEAAGSCLGRKVPDLTTHSRADRLGPLATHVISAMSSSAKRKATAKSAAHAAVAPLRTFVSRLPGGGHGCSKDIASAEEEARRAWARMLRLREKDPKVADDWERLAQAPRFSKELAALESTGWRATLLYALGLAAGGAAVGTSFATTEQRQAVRLEAARLGVQTQRGLASLAGKASAPPTAPIGEEASPEAPLSRLLAAAPKEAAPAPWVVRNAKKLSLLPVGALVTYIAALKSGQLELRHHTHKGPSRDDDPFFLDGNFATTRQEAHDADDIL